MCVVGALGQILGLYIYSASSLIYRPSSKTMFLELGEEAWWLKVPPPARTHVRICICISSIYMGLVALSLGGRTRRCLEQAAG